MNEFELIRRHFLPLGRAADAAYGIGDDAALFAPTPGQQLAVCTDTLVVGRHFLAEADPADIGWKALAVNLSDLAAMGARPRAALLALTLPAADDAWLRGFAHGFGELAAEHGVALIGGDTTRGPLTITVTVLGELPAEQALRRDGARPGDLICVTGSLGDAAAALHGATDSALQRRLHRPQPRIAAGLALRGIATAAIDVSDGILADLGHILTASGVGAELRMDRLPASPALLAAAGEARQRQQWQSGGDDYELCLCVPPERLPQAEAACAPLALTVIGQIRAEAGLKLIDEQGRLSESHAHDSGYRHF